MCKVYRGWFVPSASPSVEISDRGYRFDFLVLVLIGFLDNVLDRGN